MSEDEVQFIDIDLTDVDDGTKPIWETKGHYPVEIVQAEHRHKEGSEYPYINVTLRPLDEAKSNRRTWLTLSFNPRALWNMVQFMNAARIPKIDPETGKKGINPKRWAGQRLRITANVIPNPDDTTGTQKRNEIGPPYYAYND